MFTGFKTIDGKKYCFDDDGKMRTGFIKNGDFTYYYLPEGDLAKGFFMLDGDTYYFHESGGNMFTGRREINGQIYYFDEETGKLRSGWQTSNGNKYYYLLSGDAAKGLQVIDGDTYYFDESNGIMRTGFRTINNKKYCFDDETGKMRIGFIKNGDNTYYYLPAGDVAKGLQTIDGDTYYFDEANGIMRTGLRKIDDAFYYFSEDSGARQNGWQTINGNTYYMDPACDDAAATGFIDIDGKTYFFHKTYATLQKTGLTDVDGVRYYLDPETGEKRIGFIETDYGTLYLWEDGGIATNFQEIDGQTYHFSESGVMQTGMQVINGKKYYFEIPTGEMVTGVRLRADSGIWFYFDPECESGNRTGLQEYNGAVYLFHEVSGYALTNFQSVGDKFYFFDPSTGQARLDQSWTYCGMTLASDEDGSITITDTDGSKRALVLAWALEHLGITYWDPYVCSSFAAAAYAAAGETYLNTLGSYEQAYFALENAADSIYHDVSSLSPGDLIFWNNDNAPTCEGDNCPHKFTYNGSDYHVHHVGIYMGNNQVVEETESLGLSLVRDIIPDTDAFYVSFGVNFLDATLSPAS